MNQNQKVTFDLSTNVGEVAFANFVAKMVEKGLTFDAQVNGHKAIVTLTGGF